ncbi:MAG TPA: Xaa-Pro dipeptidase [Rhodanobacteraceae bacterium]|nr:Xaa-Pro dipeptidase [Rhodanobacteraceae bacterium]
MNELVSLYAEHLATVRQHSDAALEATGRDTLAIAAGRPAPKFLDDQDFPYAAHPHFKHWVPLTDAPGSWIIYTPGEKPRLLFMQPQDFWHPVPEAPSGYWVDHFDIVPVRNVEELADQLPKDPARCAIIGQAQDAVDRFVPDNPQAALDYLHYHRAWKTPYEVALMREANRTAARAHKAAETAFRAGESEFGIHMAYLHSALQLDAELPYHSIIALNTHGAVLHYDHFDRQPPAQSLTMLIDAGATYAGYASDITRTWANPEADEFQALIDAMDANQRELCSRVTQGQGYGELHMHAHHLAATLLKEHDFLRMSPEEAVASHVTNTFFPHGLGHLIGAQVHDVGGFQKGPDGGTIDQPEGQPFLRLTRTLEPGMAVTIEPGLYFIDMLLEKLKATPEGRHVNWSKVDAFRKYGGIRIEDDVVCTDDAPENLTRDAFGGARG